MPAVNVNGLKLNYLDRGQGAPIVLSHGFQNSGFAFTPILDRLADDLLGFLDALGLEKVDFLGHSMGGRTEPYSRSSTATA